MGDTPSPKIGEKNLYIKHLSRSRYGSTDFSRLKPGGQMLVSDIVVNRLPFWAKWSMKLYSACVSRAIGEPEYMYGLRTAGLGEIEVRERKVYGASEIEVLLNSGELPTDKPLLWRIVEGLGINPSRTIANIFADKVWSTAFYARKPLFF